MQENKNKVKLHWNGQEIEAVEGSNLLQAAIDNKIEVAHYCYHAGLSIAGVCRMCMVEQEGVPRLYPSCNATVQAGMKINNNSPKVKDTVEWALQLHLVNHPLDCTICDQAGECGLQDYYMKHGGYDSSMIDQKVHKEKVIDIGSNVMLDKERCILCSRCVRFTAEVTKTHEFGILERGDHAEITVNGELKNDYAMNTVDICPVGALTSKDFRFKQRAWFLQEVETTCIGCSTGCSVKISQNEKGAFRVKPVFDEQVNGHWMCDDGRDIYKHVSRADRLVSPLKNKGDLFTAVTDTEVLNQMRGKKLKIILNASLTNEEYESFFKGLPSHAEVALYTQPVQGKDFDGILKRSDKNSNTFGAHKIFKAYGKDASVQALETMLKNISEQDVLLFYVPEFSYGEDHLQTLTQKIKNAGLKIALTSNESAFYLRTFDFLLPMATFLEKNGTMENYAGVLRKLKAGRTYGAVDKTLADYIEMMRSL